MAVLGGMFRRTVPHGGDWSTVNVGPVFAPKPFEQHSLPGYRQIVDLSPANDSRFLEAVGQSGNVFSPHYDDSLADWSAGRYRKMRMERSGDRAGRRSDACGSLPTARSDASFRRTIDGRPRSRLADGSSDHAQNLRDRHPAAQSGHADALKFSGALYSASAMFGTPSVGDRFEAIVDLHRRQHRAAGLPHQRRAARERLPGIPHIVGQQHALAVRSRAR